MLGSVSQQLCGCSVVLKAKAPKLPPTMAALWEMEDWTTEQIAKAWEKAMGGAVEQTRSRSFTSVAAVKAELKRLDAVARAFGRSDGLKRLITEQNRIAFALGSIYIQERDAEIRRTRKLPPTGAGFRVDEEPRLVEKASKSAGATIAANFDFNLASEAALDSLDNTSLLWFRDVDGLGYSSPAARAAILEQAKNQIANGASGYAVGSSLASSAESLYGTGKFAGKGLTYWGGVSENAATVAAVRGELMQMAAMGWDRFEIVNPMDERTTPICSMLNGKTVMVPHAMDLMSRLDEATTIDEVKATKPWAAGGKPTAVAAAIGPLKAGEQNLTDKQSQALAQAGFAVPPYHFRCRSFIDIAYMEGSGGVPTQIGQVGPTGVPVKAPKPTVPSAPVVVAPPAAGPAPAGPPSPGLSPVPSGDIGLPGSFPYDLEECKWSPIKFGGQNPKFAIEAPDGSIWMFKDYSALGAEYRASVDELAAMVGRAGGVPTPETYKVTLGRNWDGWAASAGRERARRTTGSLSRIYNADEVASFDIGGGVRGLNIEKLGRPAAMDVQTDHAINWLISNGDGHYENFIMLKNGRVAGIDKGQGFKYFGKDRLAIDYISPQAPMPSTNGFAYAESQLVRYSQGKAGRDFRLTGVLDEAGELTDFGLRLRAIQDISDEAYSATIRPYISAMHKQGRGMFSRGSTLHGGSVDDALAAVLKRKNSLVADFDDLYRGLEGQRLNAIGGVPKPKPVSPEGVMLERRNLFGNPSAVLDDVAKHRMNGQAVFVGGADVEDMTMMGLRYAVKGGRGAGRFQYQFRGRLRPGASARVQQNLDDAIRGSSPGAGTAGGVKTNAELIREARTRIDEMWDGNYATGQTGIRRFIGSFNSRHIPGEAMYGQPMGAYDGIYDKITSQLEAIAKLKQAQQRARAESLLGYRPTSAEVKAAQHYLKIMRAYKRPDGTWNVDNIVPNIGFTQKLAPTNIRLGSKPKPPPADTPEDMFKPKVQRVTGAQNIEDLTQVSGTQDAITLANPWNSDAARKAASQKRRRADSVNADTYLITHPTNPQVQIRFVPHGRNVARDFEGDFRFVFSKSTPTAKDIADARRLASEIGVPLSADGASVAEMKVMWARKQARVTGLELDPATKHFFANISDDLPYEEQLKRLRTAFNKSATSVGRTRLKWNSMTREMTDADYMPVFRETSGGVAGNPQWVRRDLNQSGWEKAGVHGTRSEVTGEGALGVFESMASSGNMSMVSTTGRARSGTNWWSGMSPLEDMKSGGANYVFTRINVNFDSAAAAKRIQSGAFNPATQRVRAQPGIYYKQETLNYTDNLFYRSDLYGRVESADYIASNMVKTVSEANPYTHVRNEMTRRSNNEVIYKRSVGFDDVDMWVLKSKAERERFLEVARRNGVTQIGGKSPENFFVVGGG